jgi:hypothetical protein
MSIQKMYRAKFANRFLARLALLGLLVLPCGAASAHSNEYLMTITGEHGGMVRMADAYHFEVVAGDGEVHVWVTDHGGTSQSTAGASGSATILTGKNKMSVKLAPQGENELLGKDAKIKLDKHSKIVLAVTMKGQSPLLVKYVLSEQKSH